MVRKTKDKMDLSKKNKSTPPDNIAIDLKNAGNIIHKKWANLYMT